MAVGAICMGSRYRNGRVDWTYVSLSLDYVKGGSWQALKWVKRRIEYSVGLCVYGDSNLDEEEL